MLWMRTSVLSKKSKLQLWTNSVETDQSHCGEASFPRGNSKYALVEQAECMRKRIIYKQCRLRWDAAKCSVSSGSGLYAKICTLLVIVDYNKCKWRGPMVRDTFCQRLISVLSALLVLITSRQESIRIVIEFSHIFGPNVCANAFLRKRSYTHVISG